MNYRQCCTRRSVLVECRVCKMALNLTVKVHPVVLFQIIDSYERRNPDAERVIGTLLGKTIVNSKSTSKCLASNHMLRLAHVEIAS